MPGIAQVQAPPPDNGVVKQAEFIPQFYINIGPFCQKVKSVPENPFLILLNSITKHLDI